MVIPGVVLVVGGSALVVCSAIFWPGPPLNRNACGDRMRLWANRRKSRDDDKPRHGWRGSYRVPSAPVACE
jgi:hypothetical protein